MDRMSRNVCPAGLGVLRKVEMSTSELEAGARPMSSNGYK